ncbi:Antitoxin Phd_YefM, type II toxin-antitoxin system [Desulfonatronum thiosulfatophilum]|uniref:Antitoxin n=1 Tax=Desulfonatronum thiosulfatophilum TaxID=617002 RepID=A0A1G6DYV9_9BACT|nr:type II toxin-antitoxin system Phd/YefM family antitoxin [Desulfonatronum thiosulfatophilum]SDB50321.1 Antitoxin Phd_YefM, type II toxin-antitoxin system [Desulfonatronum thiosulfatophilum]
MKIISDREFRNNPGKLRKELEHGDVVLAKRGKPYAVMLPVMNIERLDEVLELASRIKAQMALSRVRNKAALSGMDQLSEAEIDAEISEVRKERRT